LEQIGTRSQFSCNQEVSAKGDGDGFWYEVYLFCAEEGPATGFRAALDYTKLARTSELGTS
jgi:hypothetical protein